jgi:hypothetical protein
MIRTPLLAPNCNAHAERFVRSIREEYLDRVIPLGEHLRRTLADSWRTTTVNETIKGWATSLSIVRYRSVPPDSFGHASVLAVFSVTMTATPHSSVWGPLFGH